MEVVQNAYKEPDRQVQILERQPPKTSFNGEVKRPETVVISKDDFEYLRSRALASDFVMKALKDLKDKGNELMKKVSQNRIIQELQDRLSKAELHSRRADAERLKMYNDFQDITFWMAEKPIDNDGHSIWDWFRYDKMKKQNLEHSHEYAEREVDEREM